MRPLAIKHLQQEKTPAGRRGFVPQLTDYVGGVLQLKYLNELSNRADRIRTTQAALAGTEL
jgi:hypothetical protein